jgi:hypothetical protein
MNPNEDAPKNPFAMTPEEIKAYYEKAKKEFSIEDLREFEAEADELPFSALVAELDEMVRKGKGQGGGNEPS